MMVRTHNFLSQKHLMLIFWRVSWLHNFFLYSSFFYKKQKSCRSPQWWGGIKGTTPTLTPPTDPWPQHSSEQCVKGDGHRVITRSLPPWNSVKAPRSPTPAPNTDTTTQPFRTNARFSSVVITAALWNRAVFIQNWHWISVQSPKNKKPKIKSKIDFI